jgi:TPR repeat protein
MIGGLAAKYGYAEYISRTALECDLMAAETDNNVGVSGVDYDRIVTAKAIPACRSAVQVDPDNPRLMHNLARSYDASDKYQEAAFWYRKAADLDWPSSQNNLGVLFLYGRGVPLDFAKGVELLRIATERAGGRAGAAEGVKRAEANYEKTDFITLFNGEDDGLYANILERSLVAQGFLEYVDVRGKWNPALSAALEAFKKMAQLPEEGVTLRVLDKLGVVDELSAAFHKVQQ